MTRAGRSGTLPSPGAFAGRTVAGGLSSGTVAHLRRGCGNPPGRRATGGERRSASAVFSTPRGSESGASSQILPGAAGLSSGRAADDLAVARRPLLGDGGPPRDGAWRPGRGRGTGLRLGVPASAVRGICRQTRRDQRRFTDRRGRHHRGAVRPWHLRRHRRPPRPTSGPGDSRPGRRGSSAGVKGLDRGAVRPNALSEILMTGHEMHHQRTCRHQRSVRRVRSHR